MIFTVGDSGLILRYCGRLVILWLLEILYETAGILSGAQGEIMRDCCCSIDSM